MIAFLTLPLTCIWFPDACGRLTGISGGLARPVITEETPAVFVAVGGWLLLIAGACTVVLVRMSTN